MNAEAKAPMFTPQPIGFVSSPFKNTKEIPKGLGARHEAEGALNILRAFEQGLTDIEGYSHLIVLWAFDRSDGFDLMATPPSERSPPRRIHHAISAPPQPHRPHGR
jgi:tRNA (Thr-GGU) A37 N-methylase